MSAQSVRLPDGTPHYVSWAEQWLVGGVMLAETEDVDAALRIVAPEDFWDQRLATIWAAVQATRAANQPAYLPMVALALQEAGELDRIGGEPFLARLATTELVAAYSKAFAIEAHSKMVHEWGERRRIAEQGRAMVKAAYAPQPLPENVIQASKRFRGGVSFDVG